MNRLTTIDFQQLFESAPGQHLVVTPDLSIVAASDACLAAVMATREAVLGQPLFDILSYEPAATINDLKVLLNNVLQSHITCTSAVQRQEIKKPGGSSEEKFFIYSGKPILDKKDEIAYIILTIENITAFEKTKKDKEKQEKLVASLSQHEEQLRASEQKYRFLFESNPLPMWMLSMPERDFVAVNESAVLHYGYSKEEFLSMNAKDIRPQEEVSRFSATLRQLQPGYFNAGIWRHIKKDGTIIEVEIIAHDSYYEGKPARLILAHDVTERLKAEDALRNSEEINRLIMSSSLNAIVCMDTNGKIIFWNPQAEKIFGWEKEEIIGRQLADAIIPEQYREQHRKGLEHYIKTSEGPLLKKLFEITAINKAGTEFYIELAVIPVKENGNEFFCSFIQDITERKKAEEQLKQSHEQLRQLASHLQDIREQEQKRIAREVHDELGQQITGLKMDVAWIWKKLAGIKKASPVEVKLKEMTSLLDSAVRTIRKIASELRPAILDDLGLVPALEWQTRQFQKRFLIPVEFKTSVKQLHLDPAVATGLFRLYQESLTNIARHAEAKNVFAELNVKKRQILLTITDDGKGFDVKESANKKTLGLLGMKERVLMMNGELTIKSKPKKGTRIIITIPLQEKDNVAREAEQLNI